MRPEVQVLPGPLPAVTSGNAIQRIWSAPGWAGIGPRTLTWLPLLVMTKMPRGCYPLSSVPWVGGAGGPAADGAGAELAVDATQVEPDGLGAEEQRRGGHLG